MTTLTASNHDDSSDYDYGDESEEDSGPDSGNGSITWQVAVASQDAAGIFQLSEDLRDRLTPHFCPDTSRVLTEALARYPAAKELSGEERRALVDTLMVVQHFKTHMATERDFWGLMMDKAEYAVQHVLQLWDADELDHLYGMLKSSIMHAHYLLFIQWPAERPQGPFPPMHDEKSCRVCESTSRRTSLGPRHFVCPFEDCDDAMFDWNGWEGFWRHQVETGHVICRKALDLS